MAGLVKEGGLGVSSSRPLSFSFEYSARGSRRGAVSFVRDEFVGNAAGCLELPFLIGSCSVPQREADYDPFDSELNLAQLHLDDFNGRGRGHVFSLHVNPPLNDLLSL